MQPLYPSYSYEQYWSDDPSSKDDESARSNCQFSQCMQPLFSDPQQSYSSANDLINPYNNFNNNYNYNQAAQFNAYTPQFQQQRQLLINVLNKYDINPEMAHNLQALDFFKVVLILDDSGSMNLESDTPGMITRWHELKYFADITIEIVSAINPYYGCDVFFLNSSPIRNIRHASELNNYFTAGPHGVTPLTRALESVLYDNQLYSMNGKNLLILMITDGEPTDLNGNLDVQRFEQCLLSLPYYAYVELVSLGNDPRSAAYLEMLKREQPRVNLVGNFRKESALKIRNSKRNENSFSFGDYVANSLVAPFYS
jgi:hypothetical protein